MTSDQTDVDVVMLDFSLAQYTEATGPVFAAALLERARARSIARRVRAACRRWRQVDVTVLIVFCLFHRSRSRMPA